MSSVTNRIKEVKQPRGGYLNPKAFEITIKADGNTLNANENVSPTIIGMAVDYLTRFVMEGNVEDAFSISIIGANIAKLVTGENHLGIIESLLADIKGLDDKSIINACKAVTYDVWKRNQAAALLASGANEINPDKDTIENIKIMVERSVEFWKEYGPIAASGFTFEFKGYSAVVDSGDGDYLTNDTLWDFKVSKSDPTNKHTLQLLMYYIMGKHSLQHKYDNISKIGIFNPRLNKVYTYDMNKYDASLIKQIEAEVICY